eukprot:148056-Pleurochrysis_carterae.AAC.1
MLLLGWSHLLLLHCMLHATQGAEGIWPVAAGVRNSAHALGLKCAIACVCHMFSLSFSVCTASCMHNEVPALCLPSSFEAQSFYLRNDPAICCPGRHSIPCVLPLWVCVGTLAARAISDAAASPTRPSAGYARLEHARA